MFKTYLKQAMESYGLALTERQIAQFNTYYHMMMEMNQVMNLTAITEEKEVAIKHMVDSLSCYEEEFFIEGGKVLDLGTGAGFPGIPLAIYRPDLDITLFDSLAKRLRFLEEVVAALDLKQVQVLHGRAEDMAHQAVYREQFDLVTSRAVARLPILAEWAMGYVKKGGYLVALKGMQYEEEVEEARKALYLLGGKVEKIKPVHLPELEDKRAIIYVKKERTCPKNYPRKPKVIKEKPLG